MAAVLGCMRRGLSVDDCWAVQPLAGLNSVFCPLLGLLRLHHDVGGGGLLANMAFCISYLQHVVSLC